MRAICSITLLFVNFHAPVSSSHRTAPQSCAPPASSMAAKAAKPSPPSVEAPEEALEPVVPAVELTGSTLTMPESCMSSAKPAWTLVLLVQPARRAVLTPATKLTAAHCAGFR